MEWPCWEPGSLNRKSNKQTTRWISGEVCFPSRSSSAGSTSAVTLRWQWQPRAQWACDPDAAVPESRNVIFTPGSNWCAFLQMPNAWCWSGRAAHEFRGVPTPATCLFLFIYLASLFRNWLNFCKHTGKINGLYPEESCWEQLRKLLFRKTAEQTHNTKSYARCCALLHLLARSSVDGECRALLLQPPLGTEFMQWQKLRVCFSCVFSKH